MRIQIVTCNSKREENGKYKDSYHEIHEIDNLRNIDHIIATINSVVSNNKLFKDNNDTLDSVIISGDNNDTINKVIKYYNGCVINVPIMGAETALLIM